MEALESFPVFREQLAKLFVALLLLLLLKSSAGSPGYLLWDGDWLLIRFEFNKVTVGEVALV